MALYVSVVKRSVVCPEDNVHTYVLVADHDDCGLVLHGTPVHLVHWQNLRHRLLPPIPAAHSPFAASG